MSDPQVEFAKHLRTTQFALVTTSAALLAAVIFGEPARRITPAKEEIEEVLQVRSALWEGAGWEEVQTVIWGREEVFAELCVELRHSQLLAGVERLLLRLDGSYIKTGADYSNSNYMFFDRGYSDSKIWDFTKEGLSLGDFKTAWDQLESHMLEQMELPTLGRKWQTLRVSIREGTTGFATIRSDSLEGRAVEPSECEGISPVRLQPTYSGHPYGYAFQIREGVTTYLPASTRPTSVSLLEALLEGVGKGAPDSFSIGGRAKGFSEAYPDLIAAAEGLATESLELIDGMLQLMEAKRGQQIQVLGLSLDLEHLGKWGLWLLVAVQLYFVAHLRGAVARVPAAFPWIALYRDRWFLAELALLLSVCVLPATAALSLASTALQPSTDRVFESMVVGAAVVSWLLTVLTAVALWQIRRDVPSGAERLRNPHRRLVRGHRNSAR